MHLERGGGGEEKRGKNVYYHFGKGKRKRERHVTLTPRLCRLLGRGEEKEGSARHPY